MAYSIPMSPSVTVTPHIKSNDAPSGSWDSTSLLTVDMMRSGSGIYWSYDPEHCALVMRRRSSYEPKKRVNKESAVRANTSFWSPSQPNLGTFLHSFDSDTPSSDETTLTSRVQAHNKTKSSNTGDSHTSSTNIHGLGINGLNEPSGKSFDGTGVVGTACSVAMVRSPCIVRDNIRRRSQRCHAGHDTHGNHPEQSTSHSSPSLSKTTINEISNTFTFTHPPSHPSPTSRHSRPRMIRNNAPRLSFGLAPPSQSTPAAEADPSADDDAEDLGYFASIKTLPLLGLGILSLARNGGEVFDGTGLVGLRVRTTSDEDREDDAAFELAQQVSRVLVDEVLHTFTGANTPTGMSSPVTFPVGASVIASPA